MPQIVDLSQPYGGQGKYGGTFKAIAGILDTIGRVERLRQERSLNAKIINVVAMGGGPQQIAQALAENQPQYSTGATGLLQQIAEQFAPPSMLERQYGGALTQAAIQKSLQKPTSLRTIGTGEVTSIFDPETGQITPTIHPSSRVPSTSVTVQTGDVEKSTKGQIEKDVIDLQTTLGELNQINKDYNEDFFTYRGRGRAYFTAIAEKAEIPIGQAAKQFLSQKTKFFADAKRVFLKFRKFITGVAGGIEEFKEIAKATIDPESDSPTQFQAKMTSMRDNAIRVSNLLLAIRNSGLDTKDKAIFKDAMSLISFTKIPLEVNENITLDDLINQKQEQSYNLTEQIIPDSVIDNMSLEEVEAALGKIEGNITLKPDLSKPKTSIEKGMVHQQNEMGQATTKIPKTEMSKIINVLPLSIRKEADKLTPNHRSRLYRKMTQFGYEKWKKLTDAQKRSAILQMINETRK